ncbi:bifunctional metallophosphatase/5'-nucleotidase [Deinococcus peraridilitoris]|uniref:5'-nucleotidase/2',3'-cyclic phosphodiesterase-like hydrolase n=1 Tax=Deinococcus peraridilitoris (strain DSM 19664 / LMG 22246 / CIP 109416 / KR-200) TaxID=937777 RepID=L0A480_DEIPD|nr:bifunctional metallophosphatase/5'-nucleotidase [Deinococcus peraridilitoris]AFZ68641.1 5'-nucleotidase/2',3'-cyclic phosphodiesterase-like hydrolase [Deinococcus peraridilitoris DSM 19664]
MKKPLLMGGLLTLGLAACAPNMRGQGNVVDVAVLGVNDFHGNLAPTSFSGVRIPDPADPTKQISLPAGGIEAIGGVLAEARRQNSNTIFVGVGDLIGASPLASSLLRDEPTIAAMNALDMKLSVVGNHEFDYGLKELRRMQNGGCDSNDPAKACKFNPTFTGAKFQYLAANVIEDATGKSIFPAYSIQNVGGANIAFVGAVLKETPTIVSPEGVAGLTFTDEAEAINKVIPELKSRNVDAIIALIHHGGVIDTTKEAFSTPECATLAGPIVNISNKLDPAVKVVMSAHTHRGYNCLVNGRTIIQGDAYGHLLQRVDLRIDKARHTVLGVKASTVVVDSTKVAKDPAMTALITKAKALTDPIANQQVAKLAVPQVSRTANAAGESPLGKLIADSQLAATRDAAKGGAVVAFMNPGGIRADLPVAPKADNGVTFGDVFTVQPFGNSLVVLTLTGAQIKTLLEQQFDNSGVTGQTRILQVSNGFAYKFDTTKPKDQRVSDITLNGQPLNPTASYRVTVNSFLADGGDGFTVLREGQSRLGGELDVDAFQAFIKSNAPVAPSAQDRITKLQ